MFLLLIISVGHVRTAGAEMSLSRAQNIFMPADINSIEIREMVSFELGKEIDKGAFFVLSRARDKEKILSPHKESNRVPRS